MSESRALAIRELTPTVWQMIESIAPAMHQSRLFGVTSKEQAAAIMLKGFELGLGLAASFEFIVVIQNKPTLIPRGALALIHRSSELAEMRITDKPEACTVYMKRRNGFEYETTFSMEDARKAGLVKPGGAWESYQANMLRWRATGHCADVVFPDVIGGLKRADEFGATIDSAGNVVEGEWSTVPTPAQAAEAEPPKPTRPIMPVVQGTIPDPDPVFRYALDKLIERYGVEAVLAASNGTVPNSRQEVAEATRKLEAAKEAANDEKVENIPAT